MSKTFQYTILVSVLLASGVLVTGCWSEKDRSEKKTWSVKAAGEIAPGKAERTPESAESSSPIERISSPASKPARPPGSVTATNPIRAKPTAHLKPTAHATPEALAETKAASASPVNPSDSEKPSFTSYGEGAEGAGITDPRDTKNTLSGITASTGK